MDSFVALDVILLPTASRVSAASRMLSSDHQTIGDSVGPGLFFLSFLPSCCALPTKRPPSCLSGFLRLPALQARQRLGAPPTKHPFASLMDHLWDCALRSMFEQHSKLTHTGRSVLLLRLQGIPRGLKLLAHQGRLMKRSARFSMIVGLASSKPPSPHISDSCMSPTTFARCHEHSKGSANVTPTSINSVLQ